MDVKQLDAQVAVSGQISAQDVGGITSGGASVLICNRPDGEVAGQPVSGQIQAAAEAGGLKYVDMPFTGSEPSAEQVDEFARLISTGEQIHAFCRTGNRCSIIWAKARHKLGADPAELITAGARAGYNLADLFPAAHKG